MLKLASPDGDRLTDEVLFFDLYKIMRSVPLNWETRFETQTYRRTSASTSSRVASPSSSHGRLRSVPVHRYRTPLGWWRSTLVSDALLRPTPPKGRRPSMGTIPHRYWTASRGVSIEPRRQWHALYRSTRSRGPRDRAGSRKEHAVPDSVGASVGTTPHSERPRTSSRIFITKSLMIYWHDTIPSSVPPPALIDGDRGHHSAPLSSEEFSCCRSGASLDDLCSVPLCTTTRRSCVVRRHIHPSNVAVVALGSSKTFRCGQCTLVSDRDVHAARNILLRFIK